MLFSWRRIVEGWLGVEPVAPGEDTRWHFRWNLGWPDWVLVLVLVFSVLLIVGIYLRESATASRSYRLLLAGVRLVTIAALLLMLSGVELLVDRTGLPYLIFLVDDSESMSITDAPEQESSPGMAEKSRLAQVQHWFERSSGEPMRKATSHHKLQAYSVSSSTRLVASAINEEEADELVATVKSLEAKGTESRLGTGLREVINGLRGTPPSALVIFTDGVTTQGEPLTQTAQYAARKGIPLFTVGVGNPGQARDWEIKDLLVEDTVFVGDPVTFQVKIGGQGFAGEKAAVKLIRKDTGETITEKEISLAPGASQVDAELSFRASEAGAHDYIVKVVEDPREIARENNLAVRRVEAIKEKVRVLYVESYPRYEYRFLKSLLEREETVEFHVLLADADPEFTKEDKSAVSYFPTTREELFEYDVLILGDVAPSLLSTAQWENVREFVRVEGGGVLFVAGPSFNPRAYRDTPLEELLPVSLQGATSTLTATTSTEGFRPRLTIEGRTSPVFRFGADDAESLAIMDELPELFWYAPAAGKPSSLVFAEHPSAESEGNPVPILATQYFGAGRTFYQGFTGTWRWRRRVEDLYFARYWIQAIRLLSRAKLLGKNRNAELYVDRRVYRRGDPVQVRVRLADESVLQGDTGKVTVALDRDGGISRALELSRRPDVQGVYEGVFTQTEDGTYHARLTSPSLGSAVTAEFSVSPPPGEYDRIQMNEEELKQIALATGGKYARIGEADLLLSWLPQGRKIALHTDPPIELWNKWPVLVLFTGLLTLEWVLRKRKSLL